MTKKILIAGNFGFHNIGDEAILSSMISGLKEKDHEITFCVVSGDPENTKSVFHVDAIFWKDIPDLFKKVRESDLVLLGGGGIFNDYWGVQSQTVLTRDHAGISYYSEIAILSDLLNKPLMVFGAGVGPLTTDNGRKLTKLTFEISLHSTVRDKESKLILMDLGLKNQSLEVTSDPAFCLKPDRDKGATLLSELIPDNSLPNYAVCLRNWDINCDQRDWQVKVAKGLDLLIKTHPCNLVFIPFHNLPEYPLTNDLQAAESIISYMTGPGNKIILKGTHSPEAIFGVISHCDFLIGMRLHSLIFAASSGIPAIGLIYDPKVKLMMTRLGIQSCAIDIDQVTPESLVHCLEKSLHDQYKIQKKLEEKVSSLRIIASRSVLIAMRLLKNIQAPVASLDAAREFQKELLVDHSIALFEKEDQLVQQVGLTKDLQLFIEDSSARYENKLSKQEQLIIEREKAIQEQTILLQIQKTKQHELEELNQKKENAIREQEAIIHNQEIIIQEHIDKNEEQEKIRLLLENSIIERDSAAIKQKNQHILQVRKLKQKIKIQKQLRENKEAEFLETSRKLIEQNQYMENLTSSLNAKEDDIQRLSNDLNKIYSSRGWRILLRLWSLRNFFLPRASKREKFVKSILTNPLSIFSGRWSPKIIKPPKLFRDYYIDQDNSTVTLYTDNPRICPNYVPRTTLTKNCEDHIQISLIVSIKNEIDNIDGWLDDIRKQTRLPDEMVILDGGSTDGTYELLQGRVQYFPFPIKLIQAKGANRSEGRNIAIRGAQFPIIVATDFGCQIHSDWIEKIIQPFLIDPETRVSAGFYQVTGVKDQSASQNRVWADLERVHPGSFLPSSRSVAFKKSAFEAIGGYPEWLETTGEDTYFDLELKRFGGKWAFVPEAIVEWHSPKTLKDFLKKNFEWAVGDGESGVHARYYWLYVEQLVKWVLALILITTLVLLVVLLPIKPIAFWLIVIGMLFIGMLFFVVKKSGLGISLLAQRLLGQIPQLLGFINGANRRNEVQKKRYLSLKGIIYVLAGVPIDDTGGGSRGSQIAQEFLRQGYAVVYVNKFPKYENQDLKLQITHPYLFTYQLSEFDFDEFHSTHQGLETLKHSGAIIEFPMKEFYSLINKIKAKNGKVVYDLLDDWQTSLGGDWYSVEIERHIIDLSDELVGTIPPLCNRLREMSNRSVTLVPNAVNDHVFDSSLKFPRPTELPKDKRIITYVGALWGEWFDWELLVRIAENSPKSFVCVIGDYRGQCPNPTKNLYFAGLTAQNDLPAYLAHTDVAIIPWKISPITENTSPLKLYEYLAMGCPVVVPPIRALAGIPGAFLAKDRNDFIELIRILDRSKLNQNEIKEFIKKNNWKFRVQQLIELFGFNQNC